MSNLSEIIDCLERVGLGEGAHALRHVRDVAEQRQADLVAKDDRIRDYMNICEDLSRKLEEARVRIGSLEAALKPLAELDLGADYICTPITIGMCGDIIEEDIRRARTALEKDQ